MLMGLVSYLAFKSPTLPSRYAMAVTIKIINNNYNYNYNYNDSAMANDAGGKQWQLPLVLL